MGADILKKRQKTYQKHVDRNRYYLGQGDLFTIKPTQSERTILCDVVNNAIVNSGDRLTVQAIEGALISYKGKKEVSVCTKPPNSTYEQIKDLGGAAYGEVQTLHPLSGTVEITICD